MSGGPATGIVAVWSVGLATVYGRDTSYLTVQTTDARQGGTPARPAGAPVRRHNQQRSSAVATADIPEDLKYTAEHEWVRADSGTVLRVGITDFAQDALGDIVFVTLPQSGAEIQAGEPCGELESTKSVSDIYAPVSGTVGAVNGALDANPELVNSDPYGEGWMFEVEVSGLEALDGLLDAAGYRAVAEK